MLNPKNLQTSRIWRLTIVSLLFSPLSSIVKATDATVPHTEPCYSDYDHNHHRIQNLQQSNDERDIGIADYQADFEGFDRSLIGRAASDYIEVHDDIATDAEISAGQTQNYVFLQSSVFAPRVSANIGLPPEWSPLSNILDSASIIQLLAPSSNGSDPNFGKRQSQGSPYVFISASTCSQPNTDQNSDSPQLTLHVSTTDTNQKPGPGGSPQTSVTFAQGYAQMAIEATGNVYIGVSSPSGTGSWSYQLSASINGFYINSANLTYGFVLDTDSQSALLTTQNLTDSSDSLIQNQWITLRDDPPFQLFVFNSSNSNTYNGLTNSYCAMSKIAASGLNISSTITTRNNGAPKQQFYIQGLNPLSNYSAFIGYQHNNTDGGITGTGGIIWGRMSFTTKADGNCKIIYGLPFCSDVAYAVPSNSSSTLSELSSFYDSYSQSLYKNFSLSLQQVACNTSTTSQYSLARNCNHCSRDYKNWLCAVTIPQCYDFSDQSMNLMARNIGQQTINGTQANLDNSGLPANATNLVWFNSSRSSIIDTEIQPGPYRELLPCINLCYELVKSCPAALAFSCPSQRSLLNKSYGIYGDGFSNPGSCNYLGKDPIFNDATRRNAELLMSSALIALIHIILVWS